MSNITTDLKFLPSISIIVVTFNCEKILEECLESINMQNYPTEKVEVLVIDGGSSDKTVDIAREHNARVIFGGFPENQEPRRAIGLLNSKNDLVAFIDSDNLLPDNNWLREAVQPLIEDKEIVATQPLYFTYRKSDSVINRYFALIGVNDPVAYYLRKSDRLTYFARTWNLYGKAADKGKYLKVEFDTKYMPPLGCNGFVARRKKLINLSLNNEMLIPSFTHTDAAYDLINGGEKYFGIVKNGIIHVTSKGSFLKYLIKRTFYINMHTFSGMPRKYKVFDLKKTKDAFNLVKFVLISLTIIIPLFDSIRGFIKINDIAWFVHPIMCISMLFYYSVTTIISKIKFKVVRVKR